MSNEVHRKTDTLFPGNSMTIAELEPLIIQLGGSISNHYAQSLITMPLCLLKKRVPINPLYVAEKQYRDNASILTAKKYTCTNTNVKV